MSQELASLIAEQVSTLLNSAGARAPRAVERLAKAATTLINAASPGDYQSVALHCRDALIDYADSVFSPDFADGEAVPAHDQFANKIQMTLRTLGDKGGSEKAGKLLRHLAEHVQSRQHDMAADIEDAASVVHLSTTVICETERLLANAAKSDALIREFRVYRCPICRSRTLDKDAIVNSEWADGAPHSYLVGWQLFCTECGWRQDP